MDTCDYQDTWSGEQRVATDSYKGSVAGLRAVSVSFSEGYVPGRGVGLPGKYFPLTRMAQYGTIFISVKGNTWPEAASGGVEGNRLRRVAKSGRKKPPSPPWSCKSMVKRGPEFRGGKVLC